jgi:hypothetical protein
MEVCFDRQFELKSGSAIRIACCPQSVKAFMNLAAQSFLLQVSTQEEGLDRLAEFGNSLLGRVLHVAAGERKICRRSR